MTSVQVDNWLYDNGFGAAMSSNAGPANRSSVLPPVSTSQVQPLPLIGVAGDFLPFGHPKEELSPSLLSRTSSDEHVQGRRRSSVDEFPGDSNGGSARRRAQNRAAQKAFRERKERKVHEMQAELDELRSNHVRLQKEYVSLQQRHDKLEQMLELITCDGDGNTKNRELSRFLNIVLGKAPAAVKRTQLPPSDTTG